MRTGESAVTERLEGEKLQEIVDMLCSRVATVVMEDETSESMDEEEKIEWMQEREVTAAEMQRGE